MKNVYIDSGESIWLKEYFKGDFVTVDEIISACEDLIIENKELKQDIEDLEQNLRDNYKPIEPDYD